MKRVVLLSLLVSSILFATNGDNMISLGPESRSMGGTGIAYEMGADSVFRNPAWLSDVKGTSGLFGATIFMPTVSAKNSAPNMGSGVSAKSKADLSLIPEIAVTSHINSDLSYGFGMFGVSGMGVDYRNEDMTKGLSNMRTNFQYMRFVPSLSYKVDNLRVGGGLSVAYGSLNMAAMMPSVTDPTNPATIAQRSGGSSEDIAFGIQVGLGYHVMSGVTLGAYYQSQIDTTYEDVFDFNTDGIYDDLDLSQPAEYGFGIGYRGFAYSVTFDYRRIAWSDADGYDKFGWEDQDVFALGIAYELNMLTLRAGYNYSESPLKNISSTTMSPANFQNAYFNMMGFPAFSDSHYTFGLGYKISKNVGLDLAYVYAPDVTEKVFGIESSNEQSSVSAAIKYNF